jgi:hypothetical protein
MTRCPPSAAERRASRFWNRHPRGAGGVMIAGRRAALPAPPRLAVSQIVLAAAWVA